MDESKQNQKHCRLFVLLSHAVFYYELNLFLCLSILGCAACCRLPPQVIKAIQPFVSPFYDRMPGLISVVDPPFVAKKAPVETRRQTKW